jgi:hypothetical protein
LIVLADHQDAAQREKVEKVGRDHAAIKPFFKNSQPASFKRLLEAIPQFQ